MRSSLSRCPTARDARGPLRHRSAACAAISSAAKPRDSRASASYPSATGASCTMLSKATAHDGPLPPARCDRRGAVATPAHAQGEVVVVRFSVTELPPYVPSLVCAFSTVLVEPSGLTTLVEELELEFPVTGSLLL